ncbi:hypothetical protein F01_420622 [Burkholderia cenocepacia]|nr:hypothetical protein F01_420622 [Burkholderia cenocepacia]
MRRLPCLRDELQGMEHVRRSRQPCRSASVRRRSVRHVLQPRADLRGRRVPDDGHDPLPEVVPALRGPAVRAGLPDRRELQAQVGRHRAGRLRQVHRLQVLRVGMSVRRARTRRRPQGDDEVHAVRGPHRQRSAAGARSQAGLRARLPDVGAAVRRRARPGIGRVARDPRPRRLCADARVGHAAVEPLPAAREDRSIVRMRQQRRMRQRIERARRRFVRGPRGARRHRSRVAGDPALSDAHFIQTQTEFPCAQPFRSFFSPRCAAPHRACC